VIPKSRFEPWETVRPRELVQTHGITDCHENAAHLPQRNARQCRERWFNYINPNLVNAEWTEAEDDILMQTYEEAGPKWLVIANCLPGRSRNNVKNRYFMLQRRASCDFGNRSAFPPLPGQMPIQLQPPQIVAPTATAIASASTAQVDELFQWPESLREDELFEWGDDGSRFNGF
jgi:hypothetical protein